MIIVKKIILLQREKCQMRNIVRNILLFSKKLAEVTTPKRCMHCYKEKPLQAVLKNGFGGATGIIYLCDECRKKYELRELGKCY